MAKWATVDGNVIEDGVQDEPWFVAGIQDPDGNSHRVEARYFLRDGMFWVNVDDADEHEVERRLIAAGWAQDARFLFESLGWAFGLRTIEEARQREGLPPRSNRVLTTQ